MYFFYSTTKDLSLGQIFQFAKNPTSFCLPFHVEKPLKFTSASLRQIFHFDKPVILSFNCSSLIECKGLKWRVCRSDSLIAVIGSLNWSRNDGFAKVICLPKWRFCRIGLIDQFVYVPSLSKKGILGVGKDFFLRRWLLKIRIGEWRCRS